jgi:hypothetical protein
MVFLSWKTAGLCKMDWGRLLGQNQLAVLGDPQAVGFAVVADQDFPIALE